jgi:aspartate aminotransferase
VAADPDTAAAVHSHVKKAIRANYSNPPAHGAAIVRTILSDAGLTGQWQSELAVMRDRINTMRRQFAQTLKSVGGPDWPFITRQRGMFSLTPLTPEQVDRLREDHAVYAVRSGRINVAGMTEDNMRRLCQAVAGVV